MDKSCITKKHKKLELHFVANFTVFIKWLVLEAKNLYCLYKIFEKFAANYI